MPAISSLVSLHRGSVPVSGIAASTAMCSSRLDTKVGLHWRQGRSTDERSKLDARLRGKLVRPNLVTECFSLASLLILVFSTKRAEETTL